MNRKPVLTAVATLTLAAGVATASAAASHLSSPGVSPSASSYHSRMLTASSSSSVAPAAASATANRAASSRSTKAQAQSASDSQSEDKSNWKTRSLLTPVGVPVLVPLPNAAVVTIDGRPNFADSRLYDITVSAAGTATTITVYGAGALQGTTIHQELIHLPSVAANVSLSAFYRYDASQTTPVVQTGGQSVNLPFDPSNTQWLTSQGMEGTLTIDLHVTAQGTPVDETVSIPLVGQVLGIKG